MCCLLNFALNVDLTDGLIHFPSLFYFCLFCITQSDIINLQISIVTFSVIFSVFVGDVIYEGKNKDNNRNKLSRN